VNGKAQSKVERFRAYDSYADSFKDYAKLITDNPRYEKVMASAGDASKFAQGLQRAGYATDPQYANKLTRIIRQSLA
jgi:flagellar protein FlgJ